MRSAYDNGCGTLEDAAVDAPRLTTQVLLEDARSVIGCNDSPDLFFDNSINPYRGVRAWLHLLQRAAHAQLFGFVAWAGL